jgi:hypothetical protein
VDKRKAPPSTIGSIRTPSPEQPVYGRRSPGTFPTSPPPSRLLLCHRGKGLREVFSLFLFSLSPRHCPLPTDRRVLTRTFVRDRALMRIGRYDTAAHHRLGQVCEPACVVSLRCFIRIEARSGRTDSIEPRPSLHMAESRPGPRRTSSWEALSVRQICHPGFRSPYLLQSASTTTFHFHACCRADSLKPREQPHTPAHALRMHPSYSNFHYLQRKLALLQRWTCALRPPCPSSFSPAVALCLHVLVGIVCCPNDGAIAAC